MTLAKSRHFPPLKKKKVGLCVTFNENNKYIQIADSWEALKSQVKKLAKETSAEQRKEKDSELKILNKDLLELRKLIDQPQSTKEDAIAYNDLKKF